MACRVELKKDDLKAAIENYARVQYRAARNADNEAIRKIYNDLGDIFANSLQTVMDVK